MKRDYYAHDGIYQKRRAAGWSGWATNKQVEEYYEILERTLRTEYTPSTGRVLELGCGDGCNALWFKVRGYDVYGVDIAPTAIEWARNKASEQHLDVDFRVGDVLNLDGFDDNAFELVLDGHCFHCIIGDDRAAFLASAFRVLRPGGLFHVCTMCGEVTGPEFSAMFDSESRCLVRDDIAMRYIGMPDNILGELESVGFKIVHWEIEPRKEADDQDDLIVAATK